MPENEFVTIEKEGQNLRRGNTPRLLALVAGIVIASACIPQDAVSQTQLQGLTAGSPEKPGAGKTKTKKQKQAECHAEAKQKKLKGRELRELLKECMKR